MSTCDMCGKELFMDLPAQGVFTFKFYTLEKIGTCRYRVTPDPENYPICDACWKKQMRSLAEQLGKAEKPLRHRQK